MPAKLPKKPLTPYFVPVTDVDDDHTRFINLAHAKKIDWCRLAGFAEAMPCIVLSDDTSFPVWARAEIAALAKAIGTSPDMLRKPAKK